MPGTRESVEIVKYLIETCRDGQNDYLHAESQVEDPKLKAYFKGQGLERGRFAGELEEASTPLGDVDASDTGTLAGVMHRAWFDLKGDLGAGNHEVLVSVEQGEDRAKKAYEDAIEAALPEMLLAIIREQYASVTAAHDRIRDWRDSNIEQLRITRIRTARSIQLITRSYRDLWTDAHSPPVRSRGRNTSLQYVLSSSCILQHPISGGGDFDGDESLPLNAQSKRRLTPYNSHEGFS